MKSKSGAKVRSGVKGGRLSANENQAVVKAPKVRSGVRGGKLSANANERLSSVKAG